jgi:hypothetical protein
VQTEPNKDRDEYPPAVIDNTVYPGNDEHDIELIDSSDNRGAGVSIKNQITDLDGKPIVTNGTPVIVIPVLPPPKRYWGG